MHFWSRAGDNAEVMEWYELAMEQGCDVDGWYVPPTLDCAVLDEPCQQQRHDRAGRRCCQLAHRAHGGWLLMENTPVEDRTYVYHGSELEVVLLGFYLWLRHFPGRRVDRHYCRRRCNAVGADLAPAKPVLQCRRKVVYYL